MKKNILLILLFIMFIPFIVDAKSGYLYDVLKNEAESGGLAKEYTGEHHDSFTEEPSKKIYHWYAGENDNDTANQILDKWNVIFAGFCWQMIRTTDTGGVKMIYNGVPSDGQCNNTGLAQQIGTSVFNPHDNSPAYVGYMYNSSSLITYKADTAATSGSLFGTGVTYSAGSYTLTNTSTTYDSTHHYTCNNTFGTCSTVRYYYYDNHYTELNDGRNIEEALVDMLSANNVNQTSSIIKTKIDTWYQNNMTYYTLKLEDTIFCNDRSIKTLGGWNPNGGGKSTSLRFNNYTLNSNLSCTNITDRFCMINTKAQLTYPVGLMTSSEMNLLGNDNLRKTGDAYYLASPSNFGYSSHAIESYIITLGSFAYNGVNFTRGIRPSISLTSGTFYMNGEGSRNNPYIVRDLYKSNIIINNDNSKGTISNIDNTTNVEELSEVTFSITPKAGYLVKEIKIKDSNNQDVEYAKSNNTYSFIMPGSDTTITPIYEKVKSSISVEIVNETENLNINITDMTQVEYAEEVSFKVTPIKGYKVNSIKILDEANNEIDYTTIDNKNFTFIMPATDVTIIPSYEKVSSAINIDDNKNTKEIIIEVEDARAVVYDDVVRIKVIPKNGYEVKKLLITDKHDNNINYKKTSNKYEYEFVMPDTDVLVVPVYRKIATGDTNLFSNPKTKYSIIVSLLLILIVVSTYLFYKHKKKC